MQFVARVLRAYLQDDITPVSRLSSRRNWGIAIVYVEPVT